MTQSFLFLLHRVGGHGDPHHDDNGQDGQIREEGVSLVQDLQ